MTQAGKHYGFSIYSYMLSTWELRTDSALPGDIVGVNIVRVVSPHMSGVLIHWDLLSIHWYLQSIHWYLLSIHWYLLSIHW